MFAYVLNVGIGDLVSCAGASCADSDYAALAVACPQCIRANPTVIHEFMGDVGLSRGHPLELCLGPFDIPGPVLQANSGLLVPALLGASFTIANNGASYTAQNFFPRLDTATVADANNALTSSRGDVLQQFHSANGNFNWDTFSCDTTLAAHGVSFNGPAIGTLPDFSATLANGGDYSSSLFSLRTFDNVGVNGVACNPGQSSYYVDFALFRHAKLYEVTINVSSAGPDGNGDLPILTIHGSGGDSPATQLAARLEGGGQGATFRRGTQSTFRIIAPDLGIIESVTISSPYNRAWVVSCILVTDLVDSQTTACGLGLGQRVLATPVTLQKGSGCPGIP